MDPPPPTKVQRLYDALRGRILSGEYGPGFRLVIDQLAKEFEVSAVPVREAIRRLEAEGLIVHRPNVGAQVTPAEPGLYEKELTVLAVLEGYATGLAAPSLDAEDIARLEAATDQMMVAMEEMNPLAFSAHNRAFHEVFYERCENEALVALMSEVEKRLDAIRRTVFTHIPYRGPGSIAEHRGLVALIESGAEPPEIEAAARDHKLATVESFRRWKTEHGGEPAQMSSASGSGG